MKRVDINVDIGEGFPYDEALLEFATSANVCCGEHAGSWELTLATIEMCSLKGIRIGCHPGYPDREGFGRREPTQGQFHEWHSSLRSQVERFEETTTAAYVKPHGDWYTRLCGPSLIGVPTLVFVCKANDLRPLLLADSAIAVALAAISMHPIREGFADRRYRDDLTLVPRSDSNAILEDPIEISKQVLWLAPSVDSICLHGDTPNCVELAQLVRKTLLDAGYEVGY